MNSPLTIDSFHTPGLNDVFGKLGSGTSLFSSNIFHVVPLVVFIIFFIVYCIISGVLFYHWRTYGMKNKMIIGAEVLFSVVSLAGFWSIILVLSNIT